MYEKLIEGEVRGHRIADQFPSNISKLKYQDVSYDC